MLEPTRLAPRNCAYVRQQEQLGLGDAIWWARDIIGDEPFAIFLQDEFMVGSPGCMKQMVDQQHFDSVTFHGDRYDCGGKICFLEACVSVALAREDMASEARAVIERSRHRS